MGLRARRIAAGAAAAAACAAALAGTVLAAPEGGALVGGGYAGATAQGKKITFGLSSDGTALRSVKTTVLARCGGKQRTQPLSVSGPLAVSPAGAFSAAAIGAKILTLRGRLAVSGAVSGSLRLRWKDRGVACDTGVLGWTGHSLAQPVETAPPPATTTAPAPAPVPAPAPAPTPVTGNGTYCGFTTQEGKSLCLDVASDGRTVTQFKVEVLSECGSNDWYIVTVTVPSDLPIGDDRTFSYSYASGDLAGSTIQGTFDGQGSVSGTIHVHAVFEQDGKENDCESQTESWNARLGA